MIIVIGLLILLGGREWLLAPDGKIHVRFLDVGQGDAILIESSDGKRILIDGGPDLSVLKRLGETLPFFRRRIDIVINTHPDIDHIGGLLSVLSRYRIGLLILPYAEEQSSLLTALLAIAAEHRVPVRMAGAGETIVMGSGTTLSVLWPPPGMPTGFPKTGNNHSLVLLLERNGKRALLAGDMEEPVEKTLVSAGADLRADLLKIGHHGSRTSSGTGFLLAVKPVAAIISVGKDNTFGHPRPEIIRRLQNLGITIRRTDEEGTIDMSW
jgi:competence protein ComEC